MTSVATSFFAPLAASSPGVVTAAQPAMVPFGAVLSAVAANYTGTAAAPGAALMDETTLATTGIATLLATASSAASVPAVATTTAIAAPMTTSSPPTPVLAATPEGDRVHGGAAAAPPAQAQAQALAATPAIATPPAAATPITPTPDATPNAASAAPLAPALPAPAAAPAITTATSVDMAPATTSPDIGADDGPVAVDEAKAGEGRSDPEATKPPAPSAPGTPPTAKSPMPARDTTATTTPSRDPTALPETGVPVAALTTKPAVIATPPGSSSEAGTDHPKASRARYDRLAGDSTTTEPSVVPAAPLPLPLAAIAPAAQPPATISNPDMKADTRADTPIAASSARAGTADVKGHVPLAANPLVAPIGEGRGERQSSTGHDAHAAPSHTASPTDNAPDHAAPSEGSAAFTLPSLPGPAATSERAAAIATPATITAQPGRIGQELGIAIAHHVARGDATGGGDTITLRLNPVDMGKIEVKLSFDDGGTLRAVVSADNATALDMLRRDSADLGRALTDAGVRADSQTLRFDSRAGTGQGTGQSGGQGGGNGNPWQRQADQRADTMSDTGAGATDDITTAYRPLRMRGRVDMVA